MCEKKHLWYSLVEQFSLAVYRHDRYCLFRSALNHAMHRAGRPLYRVRYHIGVLAGPSYRRCTSWWNMDKTPSPSVPGSECRGGARDQPAVKSRRTRREEGRKQHYPVRFSSQDRNCTRSDSVYHIKLGNYFRGVRLSGQTSKIVLAQSAQSLSRNDHRPDI